MGWLKVALALIELARWIAGKVEEYDDLNRAEAIVLRKHLEKTDAAIAKARAARAGANAGGVRDPDQHSRD